MIMASIESKSGLNHYHFECKIINLGETLSMVKLMNGGKDENGTQGRFDISENIFRLPRTF